jgi:lipoate-protein ligase A
LQRPVTAAEEQAWNGAALRQPVRAPEVRVWTYARPGVVLGCAQRAGAEELERAARAGVDLVGRATGGGAVLVGPWLVGASVVLPPGHPLVLPALAASYRWLGEAHARCLAAAGVDGRIVERPVRGALPWACFSGVGHGEVVVAGRKIVGLAQARRREGVLLTAGTLVADPPWALLCEILGAPPETAGMLSAATTSVAEVSGAAAAAHELAAALDAELVAAVGASR